MKAPYNLRFFCTKAIMLTITIIAEKKSKSKFSLDCQKLPKNPHTCDTTLITKIIYCKNLWITNFIMKYTSLVQTIYRLSPPCRVRLVDTWHHLILVEVMPIWPNCSTQYPIPLHCISDPTKHTYNNTINLCSTTWPNHLNWIIPHSTCVRIYCKMAQ